MTTLKTPPLWPPTLTSNSGFEQTFLQLHACITDLSARSRQVRRHESLAPHGLVRQSAHTHLSHSSGRCSDDRYTQILRSGVTVDVAEPAPVPPAATRTRERNRLLNFHVHTRLFVNTPKGQPPSCIRHPPHHSQSAAEAVTARESRTSQ